MPRIVGKWRGETPSKQTQFEIEFYKDGTCLVQTSPDRLDRKKGGSSVRGRYSVLGKEIKVVTGTGNDEGITTYDIKFSSIIMRPPRGTNLPPLKYKRVR